jgi:hypothetical protein
MTRNGSRTRWWSSGPGCLVGLCLSPVLFGCYESYSTLGDAASEAAPETDSLAPCGDSGCASRTVEQSGVCSGLTAQVEPLGDATPLHVIGVYEGGVGEGCGLGRPACAIDVYLGCTFRPVILAFTSYDPVRWIVHAEPGAMIARILVGSALRGSSVEGIADVPVDILPEGTPYGYCWPSCGGGGDTSAMIEGLEALAGASMTSFEGCYTGREFRLAHVCLAPAVSRNAPSAPLPRFVRAGRLTALAVHRILARPARGRSRRESVDRAA